MASCIAAELAKGSSMLSVVKIAKRFVDTALDYSKDLVIGNGVQGPFDHFLALKNINQSSCRPDRFKPNDLFLYAVTDSHMNRKWGRSIAEAVKAAVEGGATIVQISLPLSLSPDSDSRITTKAPPASLCLQSRSILCSLRACGRLCLTASVAVRRSLFAATSSVSRSALFKRIQATRTGQYFPRTIVFCIIAFLLNQLKMTSPDTLIFMELAIQQAKLALDALEVPVGCVIVEDGKVIASGRNRTTETRNATRHAEMEAIDVLLEQWQKNGLSMTEVAKKFSNCSLYVTCEPCIMCASALATLGIKDVFYGCSNDKFGGCGSILSLHLKDTASLNKGFKCAGGIMATEAILLLRTFYDQGNPNAPKPHRPLAHQATT